MKSLTPIHAVFASLTMLIACVLASVGCDGPAATGADPAVVAEMRRQFSLAAEPDGALTLEQLRDAALGDGDDEAAPVGPIQTAEEMLAGQSVTLVGRVGGMPNPWKESEKAFPWREGEASFFLVDPDAADEFAEHAAGDPDHLSTCAHCARIAEEKAAGSVVLVTFTNKSGEPVRIDSRELFGLSDGDTVVVSGVAQPLPGNQMMILADGLHVR